MGSKKRRLIAAAEILLLLPAIVFLAAVLARLLLPLQPAAQPVVSWYSDRAWTLWVLLIALPLAALLTGAVTLVQAGRGLSAALRGPLDARIVLAATLAAGLILIIVALHMLAT